MPTTSFNKMQTEADKLISVWEVNPTFALGDFTLEAFTSLVDSFKAKRKAGIDLRTQLKGITRETNDTADKIAESLMRVRGGFRVFFGADSLQYEQVGGTRISTRRARRLKAVDDTTTTAT